jgi:hypothetical protein
MEKKHIVLLILEENELLDQMLQLQGYGTLCLHNVLLDMKRERRSTMHMQHMLKSISQRMKSMSFSQWCFQAHDRE